MIFVDTSAWYARYAARDAHHARARALFVAAEQPLLTTDYVVDETLTLLKARGNYEQALRLGPILFRGLIATLIYVTPDDLAAAWQVFATHRDKDWSFTDCVSYVVMKRLSIREAIAMDRHFDQFGFVVVRS